MFDPVRPPDRLLGIPLGMRAAHLSLMGKKFLVPCGPPCTKLIHVQTDTNSLGRTRTLWCFAHSCCAQSNSLAQSCTRLSGRWELSLLHLWVFPIRFLVHLCECSLLQSKNLPITFQKTGGEVKFSVPLNPSKNVLPKK